MEDIISKIIDIKNKEDIIPLPDIIISIKNENENIFSFQVKDYQPENNIHIINLGKLNTNFFVNDNLQIKCNYNKNIEIYCINPFNKSNIYNDKWYVLGTTEKKKDKNFIILKIIVDNCKHILYISFNTIQKNILSNINNYPVEISFYIENNDKTNNFVNNFSNNMIKILDIPSNNFLTLKINKNILIYCSFIILPLDNLITTSQITNNLLELLNMREKISYYKNKQIIKINEIYEILNTNLVSIDKIYFYSDKKMFSGIQISSGENQLYKKNINIKPNYKKNIINIQGDDNNKKIKILIQMKNKNYKINYQSDIDNIIINDNIFFIETIQSFYIDIVIIQNIYSYNANIKTEICEVNKIPLFFNIIKKHKESHSLYNLLNNSERSKTFIFIMLIGLISGILYFKIHNKKREKEENNDEELIFTPMYNKQIDMDNKILKKKINDLKYKKYHLDNEFFN